MGKTMININKSAVEAKIMGQWKKALPMLTEEILNDCNQYCKRESGDLIESSHTHTDFKKGIMIWKKPYARRQYWEIKTAITDNGNPKATWKWVHAAKAERESTWIRQAAVLMGVKS